MSFVLDVTNIVSKLFISLKKKSFILSLQAIEKG